MNEFFVYSLIFILLHGTFMMVDEFYFHHKRGLPKWERIGHPIDTLFALVCFAIVIFLPQTKINLILFFIAFVLSCFIVIKDEAQHLKFCCKYEQFIHAFVFILHPIFLFNVFLSWSSFSPAYFQILDILSSPSIKFLVMLQVGSICLFLLYQIIYWNFIRANEKN